MDINRRSFLVGSGSLVIAAPAIVRVASIMPVRALRLPRPGWDEIIDELRIWRGQWRDEWRAAAALIMPGERHYLTGALPS